MDRGVKIAIFAASIISLALGLIWDQVLNQARNAVESESIDELAAEIMEARMGAPDIARLEPPPGFPVQPPAEQASVAGTTPLADGQRDTITSTAPAWVDYVLKRGDSPNRLAYQIFKERGLVTGDIQAANPNSKWREGEVVRIPPGKASAAPATLGNNRPVPPPGAREPIYYEVQQNDGWSTIAYKHRERGLTWQEIEAANGGIKLTPGIKVVIP